MSINRKNVVAAAGFGAVGAVALGFLSAGAANADTFIPLPGGAIERTLSDGTVVKVRLVDEWANITGSLGSTPLHRNAFVGGTAIVDIAGSVEVAMNDAENQLVALATSVASDFRAADGPG